MSNDQCPVTNDRAARRRLPWALVIASLVIGHSLSAADYYVDNARTSNGSGTEASPWKDFYDIDWSAVNTSLASGPVTVYFSSRSTWTSPLTGTGTGAYWLNLEGAHKFNTNATGTAVWTAETDLARRARIDGSGILVPLSRSNVVYSGMELTNCAFSMADSPSYGTNLFNITVSNLFVRDVSAGVPGIAFSYASSNCHSFVITHCILTNIPNEAIYLGKANWLEDGLVNCVVEHNLVIDAGTSGEGDIDIKPCAYGAIVRYNTNYSTRALSGKTSGIVCAANAVEIYGNVIHDLQWDGADWGWGIYLNSEGDGFGVGKAITSCLIYRNLIYRCEGGGIQLIATTTTSGADISGVKIFNNTIVSNRFEGIDLRANGSRTVTVSQFTNNIVASNEVYDVKIDTGATVSAANYNLFSPGAWYFSGASKTWAEWQAAGFDANGVNGDPVLDADYQVTSSSAGLNAGAVIAGITDGYSGPAPEIGHYELTQFSGASGDAGKNRNFFRPK